MLDRLTHTAFTASTLSRSVGSVALAALAALCLAACGGGGDGLPSADNANANAPNVSDAAAAAATLTVDSMAAVQQVANLSGANANLLQSGLKVPGYPHAVDVYQPAGATRAIVFLHGEGGFTWQLAYDLGFNKVMAPVVAKNVNWDWLTRNGVVAVFAQGQKLPPSTTPTWSNHVFNSGQNDVAFLKALSAWVKAQFRVSEVSLSGHSAGGTMTARMWCEGTASFKAFVSVAGPMASSTYPVPAPTCKPAALAPYFMIVGGKDSKLPAFTKNLYVPSPTQVADGLAQDYLVDEWYRHQDRSHDLCNETPPLSGSTLTASGPTWNSCNTHSRYTVVTQADHPIASLEQFAGSRMVDLINAFVKQAP